MFSPSSKSVKLPKLLARSFIIGIAIIGLSGCAGSLLSGAGPSISAITSNGEATPYTLVDLSAQTIAPYMRMPERELVRTVAATTAPDVMLVPGDTLKVMITDDGGSERTIFAPLAQGGTVFDHVRIDSGGRISLPYVGSQEVAGKTLGGVERVIRNAIKGRATEPQVHVELVGDLSGSVLVAGAVKAPGRFSALQGPLTLLDAINRAGGPVMEPHLTRVVLRTGTQATVFNYEELLAGNNRIVPPHSEIVVERARKRFVAMGAVAQPGLHDLPSNNPSLLEVLGVAGGLSESSADASGVFVFRMSDSAADGSLPNEGKPEVFRLNLKNPEAIFIARQFLVQPEDAIYVTNAAVYEWQKVITPIVQVLVLGRTLKNGF
ncbi:polysaccharide biosynthesis/export family protein [Alcaligenaceae bacterium C4P045]|nr:polysaccharide biosynthesis/export family protein [Alcaligenaceae bacterium C4P045]